MSPTDAPSGEPGSANDAPPSAAPVEPPGIVRDFLQFLWQSKIWWLAPLIVMLGLIVLLAWLTREPPRPPTYPAF
jgi:hypothetical protein